MLVRKALWSSSPYHAHASVGMPDDAAKVWPNEFASATADGHTTSGIVRPFRTKARSDSILEVDKASGSARNGVGARSGTQATERRREDFGSIRHEGTSI